jgi:hypothetical protein
LRSAPYSADSFHDNFTIPLEYFCSQYALYLGYDQLGIHKMKTRWLNALLETESLSLNLDALEWATGQSLNKSCHYSERVRDNCVYVFRRVIDLCAYRHLSLEKRKRLSQLALQQIEAYKGESNEDFMRKTLSEIAKRLCSE